jgi:hypothetical protein
MPSFSESYSVRGDHVYKGIWEAAEGEVLPCTRELHNLQNLFAVAVMKACPYITLQSAHLF